MLFDFDADRSSRPPLDLGRMGAALRSAALLIALGATAVAFAVFAVSHAAAGRYSATARVVALPPSLSVAGAGGDDRSLTTSLVLTRAPAVLAQAARQVPGETTASIRGKISASVESDAAVIDITATDHDPKRAAAIADAVTRAFVGRARTQAAATSTLSVGEPATVPSGAVSPRPARNALAGFLLALALGVLAAVAREYRRTAAPVAADGCLPVLARFPSRRRRARARRREHERREDDARRSLCSAVLHALPPGRRNVVLVTSPGQDGRSARVAAELAGSLARISPGPGERDDADMPEAAGEAARDAYVVLDAPGLLTGADAWRAGQSADAVVLVYPAGISRQELAAARDALDRFGAPALGAVVVEEKDLWTALASGARTFHNRS